jgi:hypothetical protein
MLTIERFQAGHATEIEPQEAQALERPADMGPYEAAGNCYTARWKGRIVLIGGVADTEIGPHLWACVARGAPMVIVDRVARRFTLMFECLRLNASVRRGFPAGCRWLTSLGFKCVGQLPDGSLHYVKEAQR